MFSRKRWPVSLPVAIGAWGLAVVAGALTLGAHAGRPGDAGNPADRWPAESRIRFDATRPNLLIFLHPRCPCSRASLAELARVMARCGHRLTARAVLLQPSGATDGWADSDIVRDAAAIPGVLAFRDGDGDEARRFGAATSGHLMLHDAAGRLHHSGGITPARGHEGDSLGRDAVIDLIEAADGAEGRQCSPVFGCPLATPRTAPGRKDTR